MIARCIDIKDLDREPLEQIQRLLDQREWNSDTVSAIAAVMVRAGFEIRDLNECELEGIEQ